MPRERHKLLFSCTAALAAIAVFTSVAAAQSPAVQVVGGYAFLHDPDVSGNFPVGWFVSAGGKLAVGKFRKDWFGVSGELTSNYKTVSPLGYDITLNTYSFMGGPTFTAQNWKQLRPSAQFLVGGAMERVTSSALDIHGSTTHFAFAPGGAVDLVLTSRLAARVGASERFVVMRRHTSREFQLLVGIVAFWR